MTRRLNNILLVEDNKLTNILNTKFLKKIEVADHIHAVEDGKQAIDYLIKTGNLGESSNGEHLDPVPDLILLDLNMPVMDGWEFLDEFKKIKKDLNDPRVVVLTTSPDPNDEERAKSIEEVLDYCQKPLSRDQVDAIIKQHFSDRG